MNKITIFTAFVLSITLVLFFFLPNLKEDTQKKTPIKEIGVGKIKISFGYCKYNNEVKRLKPKWKLFKLHQDSSIIIPLQKRVKFHNLEYGSYYIEYTTIFNQKNTVEFTVSDTIVKNISLCFDYFDYSSNKNVLMLDELKDGHNLYYSFESQGCFKHRDSNEIEIIKNSDNLIAKYGGNEYRMNDSQIAILREFEIELRSNHVSGCSTIDKYEIVNQHELEFFFINDESCQWRGFENLIKLLKLQK
ncbi:hypothetical protein [Mangrovimonas sp. YM274]|uniref:hypothetical protein n=1 Tax=Mangrovimonas sp. YM274 TaxID=3070660 RepID=UPI0027DDCC58|nr:hypothetical protein [Mangrovimonas sp. YM274]WMI70114.1 hypothetical protein RBH95_07125 [Mangrovimonas sp. YM274]